MTDSCIETNLLLAVYVSSIDRYLGSFTWECRGHVSCPSCVDLCFSIASLSARGANDADQVSR